MITRKTTLILGAGASAPFGYPLGKGLRDNVLGRVATHLKNGCPSDLHQLQEEGTIREFYTRLSREGDLSVDAFLERRPEFIPLGKFFMAMDLKTQERPHALFPPRDWYEHLVAALFGGVNSAEEFEQNDLSIITYNYDRSIEHLLHEIARWRFDLDSDEAWDLIRRTIPIVHIHGILGAYPDVPYSADSSEQELFDLSEYITIIHEVGCEHKPLHDADSLLSDAEYLYILGFSMSDQNMSRLKYFNISPHSHVTQHIWCAIGSVHGMNNSLMGERVQKYGIDSGSLMST